MGNLQGTPRGWGGGGILDRKILLLGINMTYINVNSTQKKAQMVTGCKG